MIPSHDDDIYNRCDIYGRFIGEERAIKICLMFMMMEIESRCIGEESDIKRKLCSEQTRRCNEEGCPVIKMIKMMMMIMKMMKMMKMMKVMKMMMIVLRIFLILSSRLSSNGPAGACGLAAQSPVIR